MLRRRRRRRRRSTTGRGRPGSAGSSWRVRLRHSFIQSVGRSVIFSSRHSDQGSRRSRHRHRHWAHHRHLPLTGGRPRGRAPARRERPGRARTARPLRLAASPDQWEATLSHVTHPLPSLFVASRTNQRASRGGGGAEAGGGWCEPRSSGSGSRQRGFVCPRSGARASGTGRRGADKGRAPRGRRRAKSSAPLGGERDPGRGIGSQELPRPLEQWGAVPHPGGDWAGTPVMGEGDSSKDVEFSIASAAQESLLSALRGLRCHSHFRDGETEAPAEGLIEVRPTPSLDTCCGPSSVPGRSGRRKLHALGRQAHMPSTRGK